MKTVLRVILVVCILSFFLPAAKAQLAMECGDALFTEGPNPLEILGLRETNLGHSMLYFGWNTMGSPKDLKNQQFIEARSVGLRSWRTNMDGKNFWGNSS